MPCSPARARRLLTSKKAAVYRRQPFTIILKNRADGEVQDIEFKVDPGSKVTGLSLNGVFERGREVLWAANLQHRGHRVKAAMTDRRMFRTGRRGRKTRYRPARFDNRTRPKGWLPPSLMSRVGNIENWYSKLLFIAPITEAHIETVRFDMQKIDNPEIKGDQYQQGELAGYEIRNYVMDRGNHQCGYCAANGLPLEVEHVIPRSKGGSNRVSNLIPACRKCNSKKGSMPVEVFMKNKPLVLAKIKRQLKSSLKDAAAVNATRFAIGKVIKDVGLPVSFWSGGRTKMNRSKQHYPKDHWIDAAVVGESGVDVKIDGNIIPLLIKATGRGRRRVHGNDRYGFPRGKPRSAKRVFDFQTGDIARLKVGKGKYAGTNIVGRITIQANGRFVVGGISRSWKEFTLLQRGTGYDFGFLGSMQSSSAQN